MLAIRFLSNETWAEPWGGGSERVWGGPVFDFSGNGILSNERVGPTLVAADTVRDVSKIIFRFRAPGSWKFGPGKYAGPAS
jgi:hypothetical protein